MTDDRTVVDAGDRVGIGLQVGDVHVSAIFPKDADDREVTRAAARLEEAGRNELAFRRFQEEREDVQEPEDSFRSDREEAEDIVQEEQLVDDDQDGDGRTKYGHLVRTDGGRDLESSDEEQRVLRRCTKCNDEWEAKKGAIGSHNDCFSCGASGRHIETVRELSKGSDRDDVRTDGGEIVGAAGARCEEPDDIFRDGGDVDVGDEPEDIVRGDPGAAERRLEDIAKQARVLREQFDDYDDVLDLDVIAGRVHQIARRHDLELDEDRIAGGGDPR